MSGVPNRHFLGFARSIHFANARVEAGATFIEIPTSAAIEEFIARLCAQPVTPSPSFDSVVAGKSIDNGLARDADEDMSDSEESGSTVSALRPLQPGDTPRPRR
jgi:hypothetical protein